MAQGDLHRLLRRISNAIEKDSGTLRERMELYAHEIFVSRDQIRNELLIQLNDFALTERLNRSGTEKITQGARQTFGSRTGNTREQAAAGIQSLATTEGFTEKQLKVIDTQSDMFVKNILSFATTRVPGFKVTKISGDNQNFTLRIVPLRRNANTFNFIKDKMFKPAKDRMARTLSEVGIQVNAEQSKRLYNVGHITAVSEVNAARAVRNVSRGLQRIRNKPISMSSQDVAQKAFEYIELEILSKFTQFGDPEYSKQFELKTAYVRPESEASNLTDSDYEKAILTAVRTSIKNTLNSIPDWAGQRSSDSIIDLVSKDLIEKAKKTAGKNIKVQAPRTTPKDTKPNKAKNSIKRPVKKKKVVVQNYNVELPEPQNIPGPTNLRSLIPILNMRLPEYIRQNMGKNGRLVNRTGRFSESAYIVDIDEAYITYSYMKYPYQVFETRGPRDPRSLIEVSIRDMAADLAMNKFNMRRV